MRTGGGGKEGETVREGRRREGGEDSEGGEEEGRRGRQ